MDSSRPSKRQRELLEFIAGFIAGHGYGPSYREIMRALNYKSVSTVATHIDNLIAKGQLRKRDHSARSLEVVGQSKVFAARLDVSEAQEKWLVDLVNAHFARASKPGAHPAVLDELYVLVGALHILGFADAAMAGKAKLLELKKQLASE